MNIFREPTDRGIFGKHSGIPMLSIATMELSAKIDEILDSEFEKYRKKNEKSCVFFIPKQSRFDMGPRFERRGNFSHNMPKSPELSEVERDKRAVFVHQLSHRVTAPILQQFCEMAGPVRNVKLVIDKITNRFKGVAYVEFRNVDSVKIAVAMSGQKLLGVPIIMEITETEKNRIAEEAANVMKKQKEASLQKSSYERSTLLASGISHSVDERRLRSIFEPFGEINSIRLIRDNVGSSKGYAMIQYYCFYLDIKFPRTHKSLLNDLMDTC